MSTADLQFEEIIVDVPHIVNKTTEKEKTALRQGCETAYDLQVGPAEPADRAIEHGLGIIETALVLELRKRHDETTGDLNELPLGQCRAAHPEADLPDRGRLDDPTDLRPAPGFRLTRLRHGSSDVVTALKFPCACTGSGRAVNRSRNPTATSAAKSAT